jgi:hypothetical protein
MQVEFPKSAQVMTARTTSSAFARSAGFYMARNVMPALDEQVSYDV